PLRHLAGALSPSQYLARAPHRIADIPARAHGAGSRAALVFVLCLLRVTDRVWPFTRHPEVEVVAPRGGRRHPSAGGMWVGLFRGAAEGGRSVGDRHAPHGVAGGGRG